MDYDPGLYHETAADALGPANELINILLKHFAQPTAAQQTNGNYYNGSPQLIVDLGCGPGNTAVALSKAFPSATIVGLDIDSSMVTYAQKHNSLTRNDDGNHSSSGCRQFYVQDLSANWEEGWSDELKQILHLKVDAIFSNYAMHWFDDFGALANSVARMLRPNGRSVLVGNLLYTGDIATKTQTIEERNLVQVVNYPGEQKFISDFLFAFRDAAHFGHFELTYTEPLSIFPEDYYRKEFAKIPLNWYKKFVDSTKLKQLGCTEEHFDETIKKLICDDRINRVIVSGQSSNLEIRHQLWIFKIVKI